MCTIYTYTNANTQAKKMGTFLTAKKPWFQESRARAPLFKSLF